jgi:hypothetical protein
MKVGEIGVAWFPHTYTCLLVLCVGQLALLQTTYFGNIGHNACK